MAQLVKNPSAMWETWVQSLGLEDPLEKGMATHPLQDFGLENSLDCIVNGVGVAKSRTGLSDYHFQELEEILEIITALFYKLREGRLPVEKKLPDFLMFEGRKG